MKFICWYANQSMETEGRLELEEPQCFEAKSKAEAMYKYLCYRAFVTKTEPYHKSLSEHMRDSACAEGGWGFWVKQLGDNEHVYPNTIFEAWYRQYAK